MKKIRIHEKLIKSYNAVAPNELIITVSTVAVIFECIGEDLSSTQSYEFFYDIVDYDPAKPSFIPLVTNVKNLGREYDNYIVEIVK